MISIKNKSGMVLTEALVAVATLATATVILGSIITSAVDATKVSKNYLQAQNLLIEGVETVKNLRNSNWLIKPDKPECWLYAIPAALVDDPNLNCSIGSVQDNTNYHTYTSSDQWALNLVGANDLDLDKPADSNEKYRLYKVPDTNQLISTQSTNISSPYYRSVKFLSVDNDKAKFEVKVQWADGAKTRTISRQFTLYNYLK